MGEVGPAGPQLGQERDVGGAALDRSAALARTTAAALVVVGVVAALGWAWVQVRTQREIHTAGFGESPNATRFDAVARDLWALAVAFGVIGLGMLLRLVADDAQARAASGAAGARHDGAGVGAGPN